MAFAQSLGLGTTVEDKMAKTVVMRAEREAEGSA